MKVSICVPIYGVENYIERCIRSLFEQTYQNIEYIFVNDCTEDSSINILEKVILDYPEKLSSIIIISHEHNRGIAACRNTAISQCSGDFVMYVDSDDYLEKNAVELLVNKQKETDADIVSGCAIRETRDGIVLLREPEYKNQEEMLLYCIQPNLYHVVWKRLIRLSLFKDYNIQAKEGVNFGEDWQLMTQLVYYADKVTKIDDIIYHYNCLNEGSYMSQKEVKFDRRIVNQDLQSLKIVEDFFKDKDEKYMNRLMECKGAFLEYLLTVAYESKDSCYYHLLVNHILSMDKRYLEQIGWDKFKTRFINRNYIIRRLFDILHSLSH